MSESIFSSCELKDKDKVLKKEKKLKSRLLKFKDNYVWSGVKVEKYKQKGNDFDGIVRHVILGNKGEFLDFHLRYFEISPKGYSSYEIHKHEHVVICIRGKGKAKVGKKIIKMDFLDILYIAPDTPHFLFNPYDEPFGFFCIVNAKRDKPKSLKTEKRDL